MLRSLLRPQAAVRVARSSALTSRVVSVGRDYSDLPPPGPSQPVAPPLSTTIAARPSSQSDSSPLANSTSSKEELAPSSSAPPPPAPSSISQSRAESEQASEPSPTSSTLDQQSALSTERLEEILSDLLHELPDEVQEFCLKFDKLRGQTSEVKVKEARTLLNQLVSWPDRQTLEDLEDFPPRLEDTPEILELLDSFWDFLPQESREDPFVLLLALRGYAGFSELDQEANARREAIERTILDKQDTFWVARRSKMGPPTVVNEFDGPTAEACVTSVDFLRRHPLYMARPDVWAAWDGQPRKAPIAFHRQRLYLLLSTVSNKMKEAQLAPPNMSGLPDFPYDEVKSYLVSALRDCPDDPFVLLFTLHLLAATFNTSVQGRADAANLITDLEDRRFDNFVIGWDGLDDRTVRAIYEFSLVSHQTLKPVLGATERSFRGPIRRAYEFVLRLESDADRVRGFRTLGLERKPRTDDSERIEAWADEVESKTGLRPDTTSRKVLEQRLLEQKEAEAAAAGKESEKTEPAPLS